MAVINRCCKCDEPAVFRVELHVKVTNLDTDEVVGEHPEDPYEQDMMTDDYCEACAAKEGYIS